MSFLTQAFARGFFRNADMRPAKLRITKFTPAFQRPHVSRGARGVWSGGPANVQNLPREYPSVFPYGSTEWLLDQSAKLSADYYAAAEAAKAAQAMGIGERIARLRAQT